MLLENYLMKECGITYYCYAGKTTYFVDRHEIDAETATKMVIDCLASKISENLTGR